MKAGKERERGSRLGAYGCPRCQRRCICVGDDDDTPAQRRCVCGAELDPAQLPAGVYEIVGPRPSSSEANEARPSNAGDASLSQEVDIGYGKSHGYEPGHGGPSGPGDAPAE